MASSRDVSEQPVVVLEVDKLFGLRQIVQVSASRADSGDRGRMASRAQTSRLLSKIGAPEA